MKNSTSKSELQRALQKLSKATPTRSTIPILSCVLIEATEEGNKLKYSHIIKEYGPIRITYMPFEKYGETLEKAEGRLLWWYFLDHLEYPPVNYSGTPYHNDVLS